MDGREKKSIWNLDSLKEYFENRFQWIQRANDQRFEAQEKAIQTAEHSRDVAIKKAEDSIEKKSDAVYVKLTDLQKAMGEVMLRPEIESRFTALIEKIDGLKTSRDESKGKGIGLNAMIGYILAAITILAFIFK